VKDGAAKVAFVVAPPGEGGVYRGAIVASLPDETVLGTAEVVAQRVDAEFPVTVGGTALKDGRLDFVSSDAVGQMSFSIKNTSDKAFRALKLSLADAPATAVTFKIAQFRLGPGQEEPVVAQIAMPANGVAYHVLRIASADDPERYRDVQIRVERSFWRGWTLLATLVLVLIGAALSVLTRTMFPTWLARRRFRAALGEHEGAIRGCTGVSPLLKSTLLAETSRVRLVNGAIGWYAGDRAQQIEHVGQLLAALDVKRGVTTRISAVRDAMRTQLELPFAAVIEVEQMLDQAEDYLLLNHPDTATTTVDAADARRQAALSNVSIGQLRTELGKKADDFAATLNPLPTDWPELILRLAQQVVAAKPGFAQAHVADIVRAEHAAMVVQGYVDDFLPALARNPACKGFQDLFIKLLQTDRGPLAVQPLSLVLQAGLTPDSIRDELVNGRFDVVIQPDPPYFGRMMQFDLRFRDPQMQGTVAVRRLIEFEWRHGDATQPVRAERGQHYFVCPKKRGPAPHFALECEMRVPYALPAQGVADSHIATRTIKPMMPLEDNGVSMVEVANFTITALISVLVAYSAQYASVAPLDSLNVWLTPFLFGFGLDQLRNTTAQK
jgi:hypothetical protein